MPEPVSRFDGYNDAFGFVSSLLEFFPIALSNVKLHEM